MSSVEMLDRTGSDPSAFIDMDLERLHGEIKRRTRSVGSFPDRDSALRLITAVSIKTWARWGTKRYLKMELLRDNES